jgi:putative endonuclease
MDRLSLGKRSEDIAASFLRNRHFSILQRNFSCCLGELDIIAKDNGIIVFIEVRSSRGSFLHNPIDSITISKIRRIKLLSQIWLNRNNAHDSCIRFDIIGISHKQKNKAIIEYIKDAF